MPQRRARRVPECVDRDDGALGLCITSRSAELRRWAMIPDDAER